MRTRSRNATSQQADPQTTDQCELEMKITVLVVEDDPLARLNIVNELEMWGFHVYEAANVREAVFIVNEAARIHLVVADLDMAGSIDGVMFAAGVRDTWPTIEIIVTSSQSQLNRSALPKGSRFLPKPCSAAEIAYAITSMTGQRTSTFRKKDSGA